MAQKRITLLGANGQVGQALRHQHLPTNWHLEALGHLECDLTNHRAVQNTIQHQKPDLVINLAAMTTVDKCETEQEKAMAINFEAAANLATQCSVVDVPLIHISTDYVFDGKDGTKPYAVDDQMNPVNIYGQSKMMGEEAVRHELTWHVILRISSVFSEFGGNLLTRALQNIEERDEIKSVTDQIASPTPATDVAEALVAITTALLAGRGNGFGTFHLCGEPAVTRLEFMQAIMDAYAPYTQKRPKILPALSSDFPGLAERPAYTVLDCSKIKAIYGIQQKPWRKGLTKAIHNLVHDRRIIA